MLCFNQKMDKFEKRRASLQALADELGRGGIAQIAKKISKEPSYVSRMLYPPTKSGSKRIGEETLGLLQAAYPQHFGNPNTDTISEVMGNESVTPMQTSVAQCDAVRIPVLANSGAMGSGSEMLDGDYVVGDLALSPHWINQYIRPASIRELRFIHARGDSMAPTFSDGDVLLVDAGAKDPASHEGVYVLEVHGKVYVKRVRMRMDGSLEVSSDNVTIKTVDVLNGEHEVHVLGRVVWAWNGRKL